MVRKTIIDAADAGDSPDDTVRRREPANFVEADRPFFAPHLSKSIPIPRVGEYRDVKITAEGILYSHGSIMEESFARAENFRRFRRKRTFKRYEQRVLSLPVREIENVLWITDDWSKGYFHWLGDVLPRLVIASEHLGTATLLLPASLRDSDLVRDSLELLGVNDLEFINEGETVLAGRLHLPTHTPESGDFNPEVICEVRRRLTASVPAVDAPPKKLYISRRLAKRRMVVNEDEVARHLTELGFEAVEAETLAFAEQIRLFSSATHIVSIHGAGLSNMLFMPAGGRVMEFRKSDPRSPNCFCNMASALGHDFYYQICSATDEDQSPYTADLVVNVAELHCKLEQILGHE